MPAANDCRTMLKTRVCIKQQLFSCLYLILFPIADSRKEYTETDWNIGILSEQNTTKNPTCEESQVGR